MREKMSKFKILQIFCIVTIIGAIPHANCEDALSERKETHPSFLQSAFSGFCLIFISELMDRTFFLNMLYGLTHSFLKTFLISSITLLILNIAALSLGKSLPFFLYRWIIDWIAIFVFFLFGIVYIYDYYNYYNPVEDSLTLKEPLIDENGKKSAQIINEPAIDTTWSFVTSLVIAECGDKSQITAVIIGAVYNYLGVLLGTSLAMVLCIVLAIWTGNFLSQRINKRQVYLFSGITFILFGISYLLQILAIVE